MVGASAEREAVRLGARVEELDLDEAGNGVLADQRLYQLIRDPGRVRERTFEIEFLAPGAEAYCFTFG